MDRTDSWFGEKHFLLAFFFFDIKIYGECNVLIVWIHSTRRQQTGADLNFSFLS